MNVHFRYFVKTHSLREKSFKKNPFFIFRYGKNKNYLKGAQTRVAERRSGPAPVTDYQVLSAYASPIPI